MIGVWTIAHVWSLILPSMFHGYTNKAVPGRIDLPAQVSAAVEFADTVFSVSLCVEKLAVSSRCNWDMIHDNTMTNLSRLTVSTV